MTDSNNDRVALPPALLTHLQDSNWDATLAYLQQAKAAARPQQDTHERVAAAAGQGQGDGDLAWVRSRDAAQAWLIAHICLHGSRKHYAEVLAPACGSGGLGLSTNTGIGTATGGIQNQKEGLDAVTADHVTPPTPGDIRRALKRIALLIHPDKCALPSAARAFQYAQEAQAALLRDTPGKHGLRPPRKRRRRNSPGPTPCSPRTTSDHQHGPCQDNTGIDGNSSDYTSTDSEGYYSGSSEGEQEEEEGYRWWDAWDVRASQLPTPLHMRQGAGQHAGADSKQEEEGRLWQMPIVVGGHTHTHTSTHNHIPSAECRWQACVCVCVCVCMLYRTYVRWWLSVSPVSCDQPHLKTHHSVSTSASQDSGAQ